MPLSDSPVYCVGASHNTVPLDVLERFTIPERDVPRLLDGVRVPGRSPAHRTELIILSTCNRTEIYGVLDLRGTDEGSLPPRVPPVLAGIPPAVVEALERRTGLGREQMAVRLYRLESGSAERHLFRVIAGLDSLIVGETQIIGQVSRAYAAAQRALTAGPVLSLLFESAIRASRRTRPRAGAAPGAASASSRAVRQAARLAGPLSKARALVLGTGETARLVLRALREQGIAGIAVVSRSSERAADLGRRWGLAVHGTGDLPRLVAESDIVFSSTSSAAPLVTGEMVRDAMRGREGRPLLLVDIAVPRTIERSAASVPGVRLLDIDSLKEPGTREDDPRTAAVIEEELGALELRMSEMSLRPVIGGMWRKAERIRSEVLSRTRARVPELDDQAWEHIERLAAALVAKILHDPATRLRAEAGNGHAREYAEALRHLFALSEDSGSR